MRHGGRALGFRYLIVTAGACFRANELIARLGALRRPPAFGQYAVASGHGYAEILAKNFFA